ncbi:MAG: septum formation initiator family protein [Clostridia bacterium]|nr:septum formation initiator family protein [Clostridiales bacterium]MDU1029026.1 septum formation initiator family protein [Clostridiales bacterium]MDU2292279.1 septum formation initiator family protein [Peptococcus niger]MDU7244296.1 septum formation initiator family protein [Clostridiales bacterium]MDU7505894.1 septum formation initiator family protein [Clostridia bacterium]
MRHADKPQENPLFNRHLIEVLRRFFFQAKEASPYKTAFERLRWRNVVFAFLVLYLSISFVTGCYLIVDLKAQENQLIETRVEALKEQKNIKENVLYMKTDEAVEEVAREELGMVKPGEVLITQKDHAPTG